MAIGRGGMTKEMFGNRTKKMKMGGAMPPGDGGKKSFSEALGTEKTPSMKKGGMVTRGDGCCINGKTKGTMC